MKVLVVLALFSVANANVLWQEPKTNLDLVRDAFWDYVAKATQTAEDSLAQIRQSELGKEMNTKISQSADAVNQYVVALRAQVAPLTEDFMTQFTQQAEMLKARLETDLKMVNENVQPFAQDLVAQLQRQVEQLKDDMSPYTEAMDPEALKTMMMQKTQELKAQLDEKMAELQAQMGPYAEEMRVKMEKSLEEFQKSMIPLTQGFETQVAEKTQEIQQDLVRRGEELRAQLEAQANDMQAQLTILMESFTQKN